MAQTAEERKEKQHLANQKYNASEKGIANRTAYHASKRKTLPHAKQTVEERKSNRTTYRNINKERLAKASLEYRNTHKEEDQKRKRAWLLNNPEKARATRKKHMYKHCRLLGSIPLNKPFPGADAHHFDKDHIVHIPHKLHTSIRHNVWTGKGMVQINALVLVWLTRTTPEEVNDKTY